MGGAHEHMEHAEHAGHAAHSNKAIALLIAVIALGLAFAETFGKSAQTVGIELNIKASDTWNFFQAKTIRQTSLRVAADALAQQLPTVTGEETRAAMNKQIGAWRATATRYESDPKEKDGRKELMALAKKYERERDVAMARYHNYELASAAYQIGIVLASAAVISGVMMLAYAAAGLGVVGLAFTGIGLLAPDIPHDVMHWVAHFFEGSGAVAPTHSS
jgi:hypothetical protein